MSSSASSSHKVKIDSYDTNPDKVTLYAAAHTAQVQRRFEVALKPGKTEIDIENLPNGVEEDTLRVEGYGDDGVSATVVDVVCLPLNPKPTEVESAEVVELRKKIAYKNTVLQSFDAQENILRNYSNNLNPSNTPASELSSYLSLSSSKSLELAQSRTKTDEEIQALNSELNVLLSGKKDEQEEKGKSVESRERRKADELLGKRRRTVRVLVEVEGAGAEDVKESSVNLVLIYVVRGAGWSPIYDIRAKTTPSTSPTNEKSGRSYQSDQKVPLSIHYRSSITNSTGEPWIQTQIVLSTAAPDVGSAIPTLQPYRLGFPLYLQPTGSAFGYGGAAPMASAMFASAPPPPLPRGEKLMMKKRTMRSRMAHVGGDSDEDEEEEGAVGFAQRSAEVDAAGATMSAVFKIDGTSDIECDGGAHKVSIAVLKLDADLSHITVPSVAATAFLQASVKNASPYPLLPGPTTIYLDGSLVGRGRMGDVSPEETFKVSLGVDGGVRVTFHPEEKFTTTSGSFLSTKTENVSFVQKVTIENTKPKPVKILIQSRFPISEDQKIVVRLVHPSSSLPAQDTDGQGGITRWVEGKREEGMIEWCGKVGGREKKVWKYGWEVEGNGWVARPH